MTTELHTIEHALLDAVTGGYPSGFDPPAKEYKGDQWSDYLNPNAGNDQNYDLKIDPWMSQRPEDSFMDEGIIGSRPSIGGGGMSGIDI